MSDQTTSGGVSRRDFMKTTVGTDHDGGRGFAHPPDRR